MTSFKELIALFPGEDKAVISIRIKDKLMHVIYTDGSSINIEDPIQVQDIMVPEGKGKEFMAAVRAIEPTASKATYMPRNFLEGILELL